MTDQPSHLAVRSTVGRLTMSVTRPPAVTAARTAASTSAADAARRALTARRLFIVYVLVWVFEGAVRRWLLPEAQSLVYFARVPVVLLILCNSLRFRQARLPGPAAAAAIVLVSLVLFELGHVLFSDAPVTSAVLGLRLYVEPWLVPLCLAPDLRRSDAQAVLRLICFLTPPLALLAIVQVNSPSTAFVNRIFATDGSDNFGLAGETIRATSSFSSSAGHASFSLLCVAAAVGLYLSPRARRDPALCVAAGIAAAVMVITAGSRTAVIGSLAPLLLLAVAVGYRRPERLPRLLLGTLVATGIGFYGARRLAPAQIDGLVSRFTYTGAGDELNSRALGSYIDWLAAIDLPPLLGNGLAAQSQGLTNRGSTGAFVEGELIRQLFELGPPLFLIALALRLILCGMLLRRVLEPMRRGEFVPAVVLSVALPALTAGPATGQGTISGFVAICGALVLASTRGSDEPREQLAV